MIWILLIVYQIKHFLADYPLQGKYMLGKFKPGNAWILPLAAHAGVHAAFTFTIAFVSIGYVVPVSDAGLAIAMFSASLALLDGTIHFIVDRIKASPSMLGRFQALSKKEMMQVIENMKYFEENPLLTTTLQTKPQEESKIRSNTYFWWSLGADQTAHHLTHYFLIYCIYSVVSL